MTISNKYTNMLLTIISIFPINGEYKMARDVASAGTRLKVHMLPGVMERQCSWNGCYGGPIVLLTYGHYIPLHCAHMHVNTKRRKPVIVAVEV